MEKIGKAAIAAAIILAILMFSEIAFGMTDYRNSTAELGRLHPRLAEFLYDLDKNYDITLTDVWRTKDDYISWGMPPYNESAHYIHDDGYSHAFDIQSPQQGSLAKIINVHDISCALHSRRTGNGNGGEHLHCELDGFLWKGTCELLAAPPHMDDKQAWRFRHWQLGGLDMGIDCNTVRLGVAHMLQENMSFDPLSLNGYDEPCAIGIPQNHLRARFGLSCAYAKRLASPGSYTAKQVEEARTAQCGRVQCKELTNYYWQRWDYWNKVRTMQADGWPIEHIIASHLYGRTGVLVFNKSDLDNCRDWHLVNGKRYYGYYCRVARLAGLK